MSITTRPMTAEELWRMPPSDQRRELVKGELRTMAPAGFDHGAIIMKLARLLANHVEANRLGVVVGAETGFKLKTDPDTVRGVDIGFVVASRIERGGRPAGFWSGAPDLAVEVLSPSDTIEEAEEKVNDYLEAGCRMVWVVSPRLRTVATYRPNQSPAIVGEKQDLDGQDVVPGFSCKVAEIFA
jgi:Uma2 family endonuclease